MSEKELGSVELCIGTDARGHFEYEIHEVVNEGVKQFRLRLWDYKNRQRVRFAKTIDELSQHIEVLLQESLA